MGRYVEILGRKVEFISLYNETSKWKLSSWPIVLATDRPIVVWADLDQSRIPNLYLEAVLFLHSFTGLFIHSFIHPLHPFHLSTYLFKK